MVREEVDAGLVARAVGAAPVGVTVTDPHRPDNPIVYVNDAFTEITGYERAAIRGRNCRFLQGPATDPEAVAELRRAVDAREATTVELLNYRADGEPFWNAVTVAPLRDDDGELTHFVGFQEDVTARKRAEEALAERTEALEGLVERVDGLVQDVTDALMHAESREAGERAVVERIAATDPYVFAWFGELDRGADAVVPTSWAGTGDSLDGLTVPLAADDPTARAARDGEVQTATPIAGTACAAHVPSAASLAAAPIRYGDTTYGVLTVYGAEPDAFADEETVVVGALGRTVGAGIDAAQSKRLLATDTPVELDLEVSDEAFFLPALAAACDARLSFRGAAPGSGEGLAVFFAVDGDATAVVEAAADLADVASASLVSAAAGVVQFDLRPETLVADLAAAGARLRDLEVDGATARVVVELSPDTDPRSVVERVRERYPAAEVAAVREDERPPRTDREFLATLETSLTDRQYAALQTAYLGGFYEPSRETTGDELAASMGVSRSTFHQHLRAAERKLVGAVFDR